MGYRQSRFDPDFSDPDAPPRGLNTPRKRILEAALVLAMLALFVGLFEGWISTQSAVLLGIWGSAAFTWVFGAVPTHGIFKEDNPIVFKQFFAANLVMAVIATVLVFWLQPTG